MKATRKPPAHNSTLPITPGPGSFARGYTNSAASLDDLEQAKLLQELPHASIPAIMIEFALTTWFPTSTEAVMTATISRIAEERGYNEASRKIQVDPRYARPFLQYPKDRFSQFRTSLKTAAVPLLASAFHFTGRDAETIAGYVTLFRLNDQYIFPNRINESGEIQVDNSQPFRHPIVAATIADGFFKGKNCIGRRMLAQGKLGDAGKEQVTDAILCLTAFGVRRHCVSYFIALRRLIPHLTVNWCSVYRMDIRYPPTPFL
ncbi:hypothetical protein HGRIS_004308 [Hohenbuehelia grisea]|uniref:DUF6532 domain-containing protein n=1 Tax=Hohenbuehelia grisea TaxID=104357 RepID=A0ABR3IPE3_9AGAR